MNEIYVLYKQTESTKSVVTEFKNKLTALKNFVIEDYNSELPFEENYFKGNMSSVLLCFIDDEFFYETKCQLIWSAFVNRQRNSTAQLIFPILMKDIVITNFDRNKEEIFAKAEMFGFYSINDDNEIPLLYSDIMDSLSNIDKSIGGTQLVPEENITNVHYVYEVEKTLIDKFHVCNDKENASRRNEMLEEAKNALKKELKTKYKGISRKSSATKGVCVLYTGGTAGMIHNAGSLELRQANLGQLIQKLPRLSQEQFEIDFYSFKNPLDSSNIKSGHWLVMAAVIEILKNDYQGFVIIHGANTMAYSAAALSFLLDNVDRPIILTGSELGLTELNTDAEQNIQRSVEIAAYNSRNEENVRDVCILFGRKLLRGNRSTKQIALDTTEGFYSPNYPELASVSHDRVVIDSSRLKINKQSIKDEKSEIKANYKIASEPRIVICDIYPDMDMNIFRQNCRTENLGAVIIRTYGTGGIPSEDTTFINCLKELKENNKVVVNLTQCPKGNVELRIFETNATLFNLGVISGGDMVTEAAYCKLKHLFSKFEHINIVDKETKEKKDKKKAEIIRHYMMVSMHDELTMSTFIVRFGDEDNKLNIKKDTKGNFISGGESWYANPAANYSDKNNAYVNDTYAEFDPTAHITNAVLRLSGVTIRDKEKHEQSIGGKPVKMTHSIKVSLSNEKELSEVAYTDTHKREYEFDDINQAIDINIDILKQAHQALKSQCNLYVSICSELHDIEIESVHLLLSVAQKKKG